MGDRANILVVDEKAGETVVGKMYLYTHWSGYRWPEALRQALAKARGRWGDESYCTRIIISTVFSEIHEQETGGGVSTWLTDNQIGRPILIVDQNDQIVAWAEPGTELDLTAWFGHLPFSQFIALSSADYPEKED